MERGERKWGKRVTMPLQLSLAINDICGGIGYGGYDDGILSVWYLVKIIDLSLWILEMKINLLIIKVKGEKRMKLCKY